MRFENRAHFFAVLARTMRQILVGQARKQAAAGERDAGIKLVLDAAMVPSPFRLEERLTPTLLPRRLCNAIFTASLCAEQCASDAGLAKRRQRGICHV
jgi:hypothetical protein